MTYYVIEKRDKPNFKRHAPPHRHPYGSNHWCTAFASRIILCRKLQLNVSRFWLTSLAFIPGCTKCPVGVSDRALLWNSFHGTRGGRVISDATFVKSSMSVRQLRIRLATGRTRVFNACGTKAMLLTWENYAKGPTSSAVMVLVSWRSSLRIRIVIPSCTESWSYVSGHYLRLVLKHEKDAAPNICSWLHTSSSTCELL